VRFGIAGKLFARRGTQVLFSGVGTYDVKVVEF